MKILILLLMLVGVSSCATSHIMKDCVPSDDGRYICKNLKPWE